jgi:hypothetical protein
VSICIDPISLMHTSPEPKPSLTQTHLASDPITLCFGDILTRAAIGSEKLHGRIESTDGYWCLGVFRGDGPSLFDILEMGRVRLVLDRDLGRSRHVEGRGLSLV